MSRKHFPSTLHLVTLAALAIGASGAAFADDSSMSVLTGDSYAFFNNLDYRAGQFNVARAATAHPQDPVATMPRREPARTERPIMLAAPPKGVMATPPFRDNTGA